MKILLTGGAGFIGSNFAIHLLEKGHHIINVDKLTYAGNLKNLEDFLNHPNHFFHQVDICDKKSISALLGDYEPDAIMHMAAESHVDRSIDCADDFIKTNINGTYALLECALKYYKKTSNSFRFLHLSTDEVFGALGPMGRFDETSPYHPNSPYAASKASSDMLVRSYNKTHGLPTIIINASNNYGPKQYAEKLIPLIILNALEHKPLPIYGNGQQVRDWLYVEDHVKALELLLKKGEVGESYCIGANNELTNLQLVETIAEMLDEIHPSSQVSSYKKLITFVTDRPGHDFRYATDSTKLKSLGWAPVISLHNGLKETVEWYVKNFHKVSSVGNTRNRIGLGQ